MKALGIVGGIGPPSTVEYYRDYISAYRLRVTDGSYPEIIINSMNLTPFLELMGSNRLDEATDLLVGEVGKIVSAGANIGLFASNTPHLLFDAIQRRSSIPLVSIVKAACDAVESAGIKKVGLLGSKFTMQGRSYASELESRGIELVVPDIEDQLVVHQKYMDEFLLGSFATETRELLHGILRRWHRARGFDALILGGTELPLILTDSSVLGIPFLDTTKIHVAAALEAVLT